MFWDCLHLHVQHHRVKATRTEALTGYVCGLATSAFTFLHSYLIGHIKQLTSFISHSLVLFTEAKCSIVWLLSCCQKELYRPAVFLFTALHLLNCRTLSEFSGDLLFFKSQNPPSFQCRQSSVV